MKIGFYTKWNLDKGRFIGDQLYADYMCKNLLRFENVDSAKLYAPNKLPKEKLDFMIYLNDTPLIKNWAKKHIYYFQNAYNEKGSVKKLREISKYKFDLYLFVSEKLRNISEEIGNKSSLLVFGAETSVFYPREKNPKYGFDVSYVGSDVKGEEITIRYIIPAVGFNFGLFGRWGPSKKEMLRYMFFFLPKYKKLLKRLSKGYISKENISILYSSSKININCTNKDFKDFNAITARPLEILACKGFLITDDVPYLRDFLGNGAVYTSGGEDLKKKIRYYLEHEDERNKIAEAGYKKVINGETVFNKVEILIKYLKELL